MPVALPLAGRDGSTKVGVDPTMRGSVQKSGITLSNSVVDGVVVIRIGGFLDGHTFVDLERHFDQVIKAGNRRLVLELSGLTYIASAGVGLFINTNHRLKSDGGRVELVNPSPNVGEIFSILGLDAIFTLHAKVEDAVAAAKA